MDQGDTTKYQTVGVVASDLSQTTMKTVYRKPLDNFTCIC